MGFLKKIFGDAVDDLKQSLEDSKKEMLNSLSESKAVDDDDDDEPRINMGKLEDGILTISESFSELDDESLEDYKRLRKIVFPASLKKLDSDVICDQEKLEIVDFSKVTHLKEIPDDFISGETRIKEFVIPQGVTEVGDGFLGECGAGTKVFVPASVRKLGYINGNSNNDQYVYLFASHIDISDVEEDIKTLYVLSDYYGYYAKQLKECDSEARLREMPAEMMNFYVNSFAAELAKTPAEKPAKKSKDKPDAPKATKPAEATALDGLVQQIKEQIQSLGLSSFILYASDYEGDREYEEIEKLADEGLLESSTEYHLDSVDIDDGYATIYFKLRKISIEDNNVLFDAEEEYENNDGDIEIRGQYKDQTIGELLLSRNHQAVEDGLKYILNYYLNNKTLIELNGGSEKKTVVPEPVPEPAPEPEPKLNEEIRTRIQTIKEIKYDIRDFKRKKMCDLREARDEKDRNKTPENVNTWKQIISDIQTIDAAIMGGAKTLEELKIAVKHNASMVSEIDEMMGTFDSQPMIENQSIQGPASVVAPAPAPSAFSGLFSPRMEALINSALQDGVLTEQEKAILKKRAEKDGEDWDEIEMIINSRLPRQEQTSPKKAVELGVIKRAHLFLSFKSYEGDDYAYLFLIDDNQFYATDENLNNPEIPSSDYFEDLDDYGCWIENISDEYQSFKQLSESLVNDFVEARLDEYDGDTSALAIDRKYTVTIFVDKEKVYEETISCR